MKIKKHHTQRAAECAVEAELNRRGISTAKTEGSEPGIDLVAILPDGFIPVEAKGQQGHSDWFISDHGPDATVFVLVSVPTTDLAKPGAFRFFIMNKTEIAEAKKAYLQDRRSRGTSDEKWKPAIRWKDGIPHENCWEKLVTRTRPA